MARYIDTSKVHIPKGFFNDLNVPKLLDWLNSQPTVDVVPVVRCCNCIHLIATIDKETYCDFHSTNWDKFYVRPDDYCSYGERKV